jgi:hypothetical protein
MGIGAAFAGVSSAREALSSARCTESSTAGVGSASWRFHDAKTSSMDWQIDSISVKFTARAAPFRLCAARKITSTMRCCASGAGVFSSSSRPAAIDCKCSPASTLKVSLSD